MCFCIKASSICTLAKHCASEFCFFTVLSDSCKALSYKICLSKLQICAAIIFTEKCCLGQLVLQLLGEYT